MPYKDPIKAAENARERTKRYYYRHREKCIESMKNFRELNKDYFKEFGKSYRKIHGEKIKEQSKIYREANREYFRLHNRKNNIRLRTKLPISIDVIQKVYESNIKIYGSLTCYLCLNSIEFGKDSLDHKTPLSRGGDNSFENLGVTHISCNHRKFNKTEIEYREKINESLK